MAWNKVLLSHCHHRSERKGTSSWRCLDPKWIFLLLILFDQQKSASSIKFSSHLQELQISPQSCFRRVAETSNSSSAGGRGLINATRLPGMKSGRALILEPSSLRKQGWCLLCAQGCQGKMLTPSLDLL